MAKRKQPSATSSTSTSTINPPPNTNTPSSHARQLKPPSLPRAKYYSLVPLHLVFSVFSIHFLPPRSLKPAPLAKASQFVASLIQHPHLSLLIINAGLFLVQVWFSGYLRTWRRASLVTSTKNTIDQQPARLLKFDPKKIFTDVRAGQVDPRAAKAIKELAMLLQETMVITLIATGALHVTMVLLGASFIRDFAKTWLLATMVALLSIFPTAFVIGWNKGREKQTWIRIFSLCQPKNDLEIALLCPAFGACLGCWLGAIPIPLDWERPWQTWPITCVVGTSIGHALGIFAAMILCAVPTQHTINR